MSWAETIGLALHASRLAEKRARPCFAVAVLFLELNGYRFDAAQADAAIRTLALAAGDLNERGFSDWLRTNSRRAGRLSPGE